MEWRRNMLTPSASENLLADDKVCYKNCRARNDMDAHKVTENEGKRALTLVKWLSDHAIDGVRPLSSAQDLATEYLRDQSYPSHRERVDALINWETSKNFTSGFVTGLGGLLTLPFALPAGFAASWVIQARMAAAIARI
jgi:hypothetical protein